MPIRQLTVFYDASCTAKETKYPAETACEIFHIIYGIRQNLSKIKTNRPEPACTIAVPGFGPVCLLVTTHSMRQSSQGTLHAAKS